MIQFSRLGKKGRLGNGLFQLAATTGIAKGMGTEASFPRWQYEAFFTMRLHHHSMPFTHRLAEPHFHYGTEWIQDHADLDGWLQSEKYWQHCAADIRQMLRWEGGFLQKTLAKAPAADGKKTIAISVRRGDYVNNPNYYQLPASYYYLALMQHFPDWENCRLLFFSDDLKYCQHHFGCLPNACFTWGLNDIEQLCLMSQCDHFIIAHSTFSWWGAWLGEKEGSRVIRPNYLFAGELLKQNSDKDFWPERWTAFDHAGRKLDLRDVTFTIPVHHDHDDRRQNLELAVCMLQRAFDTNIIVGEQGSDRFGYMRQWCRYVKFDYAQFHRTKMLNEMCNMSDTQLVANYDCDVMMAPLQLWMSAALLRRQEAQMVYPYDGRFALVDRKAWFHRAEQALDTGIFSASPFPGMGGNDAKSVGGAVLVDRDAFLESGMENEHFISYGPEDCERWDRWTALGYAVKRVSGPLYHMNHFRGPDSNSKHPLFEENNRQLTKIRSMAPDELRAFVASWPWVNVYSTAYYQTIIQGAVRSANEVYAILKKMKVQPRTVIDVGCGLGEWGHEQAFDYTGIDFKVNKKRLLINPSKYIDHDLSQGALPVTDRYDLCICLEVAEHLPKESAGLLVKELCRLSDRVLFSAAIPLQGGMGHINEQWQSWWARLFKLNGFKPAKKQLRTLMYANEKIEVWYRQNIVLYEKGGTGAAVSDFVHPRQYLNIAGRASLS